MRKPSVIAVAVAALAAAACGKKQPGAAAAAPDAAARPAAAAQPATTTPPSGSSTTPPSAAEGGAVKGLKVVNDCPKSLTGSEEVDRTIKKACGPIQVTGDYSVNGQLTLEAGASLRMAEGVEISIGYDKPAKIIVKGTAADPVVLTSAGDQVAGFWKGLRLYSHANRSHIEGLVIEHAGDGGGALDIEAQDVVLKDSTVRDAKSIGVHLSDEATLAELSGMTFEKAGDVALSVPAAAVGGISAGNKLEPGAIVDVRGGKVGSSVKWRNPGAPYRISADVSVGGKNVPATLEIAPGTELRFADDVELSIGYDNPGSLTAVGTSDKPIVFTAAGDKAPGAWKGIRIYQHGKATLENAVIEYAGEDDNGALAVSGKGSLSLKATTLRNDRGGVDFHGDAATLKALSGCTFGPNEKFSIRMPPAQFGAVAGDNSYEKDQTVALTGGNVTTNATWNPQPARIEIAEDVTVNDGAVLTLPAGLDLAFHSGAGLGVGYSKPGTLKILGTPDKPVHLHGVAGESDHWTGIVLYGDAGGVDIENAVIEDTAGPGIDVRPRATAKIASVTCRKCGDATVWWRDCKSKPELSDLKAEDGTPVPEKKPDGCP